MSMVCFLCNIELTCEEKTYCLFDKRICEENGEEYPSIFVVLESTVSQKLDPENIHSKLLCVKCTNLIYAYEEIYEEYIKLKSKIINIYNQTSKFYETNCITDGAKEDEPNKEFINFLVTNIPDNILEIPANEVENEELKVKLITNDISNEDVLYEQIIEDETIFYGSINVEFAEPINLEMNENNFIPEEVEMIKEDNINNEATDNINQDTTIPTTVLLENQIETIGKRHYEKRFSCDLCGVNFAHRKNLSTHKRTLHFNGKTYKCDKCQCCFSRKIHLECHIRSSHTGEKPFICNICNASFAYPHIYVRHLKIHSDIKYSCDICGKKFNSRDNRDAHTFIHSHKKRYECFDCGQGFMQKSLLKTHVQNMGHKNVIVVNQPPVKSQLNEETLVL